MASGDLRASFAYSSNPAVDPDMKAALAKFDLTKSGVVTTSELVAGAKALEEARSQTAFMKKILMIHGVTMLVLLLGMLGLSVAAVELTKEVKVDGGSLVATDGTHVQVESADMTVNGRNELRARTPTSPDGRRLSGSADEDGDMVLTGTPVTTVLMTTSQTDNGRRLGQAPLQVDMLRFAQKDVDEVSKMVVETGGRVVAQLNLPEQDYRMLDVHINSIGNWAASDEHTDRRFVVRGRWTGSDSKNYDYTVVCQQGETSCKVKVKDAETIVTHFDMCDKVGICTDGCVNTDSGVTDSSNNGCSSYLVGQCGRHDDADFKASEMCCLCGGGNRR